MIDKAAVKAMEPHVSDEVVGALLSETAGIVCPYELTIAATEVAVTNGVEFCATAPWKAFKIIMTALCFLPPAAKLKLPMLSTRLVYTPTTSRG